MRVMVVGSGGREHAIAWALSRSASVNEILCVPGNAGTASIAETVHIAGDDHDGLLKLAQERQVDLTIIGPEMPLCAGLADQFRAVGLRVFGPSAAAARIEGDKAYARQLMKIANVPMAEGRVFKHYDGAKSYVESRETGMVVKAAGLAAGKGVMVCADPADALTALHDIMVDRAFGAAGDRVVVEELVKGEELSVFALVSGRTILVLETAQDHKAIGEGDTGPNTGGMGAYSPAPIATPKVLSIVERNVLVPIVDALRNDDAPFNGLLYVGLMLTPGGPKVLEFNCRFGDPETQAVLMRLESDLGELLSACVDERLDEIEVKWSPRPSVCVVMASDGYPGSYETQKAIEGLDSVSAWDDVEVFHAGTRLLGSRVVSSGGRVLGVTALGDDIAQAQRRAYEAVDAIHFENSFVRRDIGYRAIASTGGA